jgi:hypothetical protein
MNYNISCLGDLRQSKVHVVLGPSQPLVNFVLGTRPYTTWRPTTWNILIYIPYSEYFMCSRSHDIEYSNFYPKPKPKNLLPTTPTPPTLTSWPFWNSVNIMMCFLSPLGFGSYMMVFLGVPLFLLFQVAIANYLHHPQLLDWSCHPASWPSSWGFHNPWVWYDGI